MKTVLKLVAVTIVVFFLGRQLLWLVASDETQIRWTVEEMIEGFNDVRLAKATGGIHREWRSSSEKLSKSYLQDGLRYLFTQEKHPETRAFLYRAEIVEDSLSIEIDERTAQVDVEVRFLRLVGEEPEPVWHVALRNQFVETEERGWQVKLTEHKNLEGRDLRNRYRGPRNP